MQGLCDNLMASLRWELYRNLLGEVSSYIMQPRFYSSKVDLKKLRPMILKRIENRAKDYPVPAMIPVAEEVLSARALLIRGVSTLLRVFSVVTCK